MTMSFNLHAKTPIHLFCEVTKSLSMLNGVKLKWIKELLTSAHECTKHFLLRSRIYFQKSPIRSLILDPLKT